MAKNIAASVREKLMQIARDRRIDPNVLWTRYASERLLYRLSQSTHAEGFVLKGAMLFLTWTEQFLRPTMDVDLLGYGEDSGERLATVFRDVCQVETGDDGMRFDQASITTSLIRLEQAYQGKRLQLIAHLDTMRIPVQIDIGFGDVVWPTTNRITFPTLLPFPAPILLASTRETVIAEKTQAMVALGIANSRMKDFFDLYILCQQFAFTGHDTAHAIAATFARRQTEIPSAPPIALTPPFFADQQKITQWNAFIRKGTFSVPPLSETMIALAKFLLPLLAHAKAPDADHNPGHWPAGGPWQRNAISR